MPADERLLALALRPRPLPRPVRLCHSETLDSYVRRLAEGNHLSPTSIKRAIQDLPMGRSEALSCLTRYPANTLRQAIPELEVDASLSHGATSRSMLRSGLAVRAACGCCSARYSPDRGIHIWAGIGDRICHRHRRWLGAAPTHRHQFLIEEERDILDAGRRYERLRRKHGRIVDHLFPEAQDVVRRWFDQLLLPDDQRDRGLRLDRLHRHVTGQAVWEAAYYPTIIALLSIMIRVDQLRDLRPLPMDQVEEARECIRAEVTHGYIPTGGFDPFLTWLNHKPAPYERLEPQA